MFFFWKDLFNSAFEGFKYQGDFGAFKAEKNILFQASSYQIWQLRNGYFIWVLEYEFCLFFSGDSMVKWSGIRLEGLVAVVIVLFLWTRNFHTAFYFPTQAYRCVRKTYCQE